MANEIMDEARRKKKEAILFKLDVEKEFDSVEWNFILFMRGKYEHRFK